MKYGSIRPFIHAAVWRAPHEGTLPDVPGAGLKSGAVYFVTIPPRTLLSLGTPVRGTFDSSGVVVTVVDVVFYRHANPLDSVVA